MPREIPAHIQDRQWLICHACAHVVYHVPAHGDRPSGKPKPGDRCPVCKMHGPNHKGRLLLVIAHLTGDPQYAWDHEEAALFADAYRAGHDAGSRRTHPFAPTTAHTRGEPR